MLVEKCLYAIRVSQHIFSGENAFYIWMLMCVKRTHSQFGIVFWFLLRARRQLQGDENNLAEFSEEAGLGAPK